MEYNIVELFVHKYYVKEHKMPYKDKEKEKLRLQLKTQNEDPEKRKIRQARYYQNNKDKCYARCRQNVAKTLEYVRNIRKQSKCVDCGESRWQCLDFDHRDLNEKEYNINYLSHSGMSIAKIDKELAKCDVRCANCHRMRHALERED